MFTWLVYNSLCALPLVLVAWLARRWARGTPALEHVLWLLVLVRLVWPPLRRAGGSGPGGVPAQAIVSSGPASLGDELVASTTRLLGPDWSTWGSWLLLALYLATLAWIVGREVWRARLVERCLARSPAADARLARRVRAVAARLGVAAPRVRVLAEAAGPFLWSPRPWSPRKAVLALPRSPRLPAPTVLAHELAHLARRDPWVAWLELAVQALHFWNPLFWLARRQLHRAAELACDRWVVRRFPAERRAFAAALIDTAEQAAHAGFVPRAAQALGTDARDFEERLVRILAVEASAEAAPRPVLRARTLHAALAVVGLWALLVPGWAAPSLAEFRRALPELPAGTDREHWRRTLTVAEERLRSDPSDGAAELQRGLGLMGLGRAAEARAAFRAQRALGFEPAKALYNEACAEVRLANPDAALACLAQAAASGLDVAAHAAVDPDLAALRAHPALAGLSSPRAPAPAP